MPELCRFLGVSIHVLQREVERWARVRRSELRRAWDRAQEHKVPGKIPPLD